MALWHQITVVVFALTARRRQHAQTQELLCLMSQGVQCNIVLLQSMQLLVVRTCISPSDAIGWVWMCEGMYTSCGFVHG